MQCSKYETCLNAGTKCGACTATSDIYNHYPLFKDKNVMDRHTALCVLKDLSNVMSTSYDFFGHETLSISRGEFETIRKKYLDKEEE